MKISRLSKIAVVGCSMLILSSCGGGSELDDLKKQKEELKATITEAETKITEIEEKIIELGGEEVKDYPDVTVNTVEQKVFEHYITVQGQVEADDMVMVTPEVGGVITSLKVKEGDVVTKGTTIVQFSSKDITSSKEEIKTQLEVAKKLAEKQQSLYDKGLGNIIQLDQANGQVASLEQALKSLSTQGSKFSVQAPFSGVIEKVYVVEGQVAGPTSALVMLVGNNGRKVVAQLSETYLKNVSVGSKVDVELGVLDQTLSGLSVSRVGGYVDPVNRTIDMEVDLADVDGSKIVPNLMASIKVRDILDSNAIVIPSKVILKGSDQKSFVYVLSKNTELSDSIDRFDAKKVSIETGIMYEGMTTVVTGLSAGDIVVNRGKSDIYEGAVVEISEE
jgi:RND family efflux transporter MFP subunit